MEALYMLAGIMIVVICAAVSLLTAAYAARRALARFVDMMPRDAAVDQDKEREGKLSIERQLENLWAYDGRPQGKEENAYGDN